MWKSHAKQLNNRINSLQETSLRITYQDRKPSFNELLNYNKSVSIHYRNINYLLTEIYKVKTDLSSLIIGDIFSLSENNSYSVRSGVTVIRQNIRTSKFGSETVSAIARILWNDLP